MIKRRIFRNITALASRAPRSSNGRTRDFESRYDGSNPSLGALLGKINFMRHEEFKVSGEEVVKKVKQLIKEGNIRRIIIKNEDGKALVEFPLTICVVGAALLPALAAIGAVAALLTNCTLAVEKED